VCVSPVYINWLTVTSITVQLMWRVMWLRQLQCAFHATAGALQLQPLRLLVQLS